MPARTEVQGACVVQCIVEAIDWERTTATFAAEDGLVAAQLTPTSIKVAMEVSREFFIWQVSLVVVHNDQVA
jgi:hypothetical protein